MQELQNNVIRREIKAVLDTLKDTPFAPILSQLHQTYLDQKKDDDDFLRRQTNRVSQILSEERFDYETATSKWSDDLEAAIQARVRSVQNTTPCSEKNEEKIREEQKHMDEQIRLVIIRLLERYQTLMKKKKETTGRKLQKMESENLEHYEIGVAEMERQLLSHFQWFKLEIEVRDAFGRS